MKNKAVKSTNSRLNNESSYILGFSPLLPNLIVWMLIPVDRLVFSTLITLEVITGAAMVITTRHRGVYLINK